LANKIVGEGGGGDNIGSASILRPVKRRVFTFSSFFSAHLERRVDSESWPLLTGLSDHTLCTLRTILGRSPSDPPDAENST
jgi:hypothetical protein